MLEQFLMSEQEKQDLVNRIAKDISFEQEDFENDYSYDQDEQEEVR